MGIGAIMRRLTHDERVRAVRAWRDAERHRNATQRAGVAAAVARGTGRTPR